MIIALIFYSLIYSNLQQPALHVTIQGLRNNKGHVLVSLFKNEKGFPDDQKKADKKAKLEINNHSTIITFNSLETGYYAIAILHDENDDLKMNTNFFGLPKEGYGFSNNVIGLFGPPSFSKASIYYKNGTENRITIKIKY